MKRKRIDIITLGCSKNLVDSEQLMRQLEEAGYSVTHDTENPEGEIAVINTCGFIGVCNGLSFRALFTRTGH